MFPNTVFCMGTNRCLMFREAFFECSLSLSNIYLSTIVLVTLQAINHVGAGTIKGAVDIHLLVIERASKSSGFKNKRASFTEVSIAFFHTWGASLFSLRRVGGNFCFDEEVSQILGSSVGNHRWGRKNFFKVGVLHHNPPVFLQNF